jgi:hypothetical protein
VRADTARKGMQDPSSAPMQVVKEKNEKKYREKRESLGLITSMANFEHWMEHKRHTTITRRWGRKSISPRAHLLLLDGQKANLNMQLGCSGKFETDRKGR